MHFSSITLSAILYGGFALAQYPTHPTDLITINSKQQQGVTIRYKQTNICETTPGVKSFSGYIDLPASTLKDVGTYNISTFFWYFQARNNPSTAPLAIYLAGGPGESSTYSAASSESGPCWVNPDGNSTTLNPWSFNNHVNMLYIDQPVQAGFSYDKLANGTFNLLSNEIAPLSPSQKPPEVNLTFNVGTYSSQDPLGTTNTTVKSAKALWHFAENWLTQFPEYNTTNKKISIWGNSYGGYWGPASTAYFDKQFKKAEKSSKLHGFTMDTLGITNGCIDMLYQAPGFPEFAYNNTYDFEFIPKPIYEEAMQNFTKPGGCRDLILQCRALGQTGDPDWIGANQTVNEACVLATDYCLQYVGGAFNVLNNRTTFDVASKFVDGQDPCSYYVPTVPFFNQGWVQKSLGVPLNFTYNSNMVVRQYTLDLVNAPMSGTGDSLRKGIRDLEYTLQKGIKVAMVYGDRDYRCNWIGAEAVALNAKYSEHDQFINSGYEKIVSNATYSGGVTKQYGKFSFSRIFQAGHSVSAYQPETVYQIFMRSMFDRDVATGNQSILSTKYSSTGPKSSFGIKEKLPDTPPTCMVGGQYQNESVWKPYA